MSSCEESQTVRVHFRQGPSYAIPIFELELLEADVDQQLAVLYSLVQHDHFKTCLSLKTEYLIFRNTALVCQHSCQWCLVGQNRRIKSKTGSEGGLSASNLLVLIKNYASETSNVSLNKLCSVNYQTRVCVLRTDGPPRNKLVIADLYGWSVPYWSVSLFSPLEVTANRQVMSGTSKSVNLQLSTDFWQKAR